MTPEERAAHICREWHLTPDILRAITAEIRRAVDEVLGDPKQLSEWAFKKGQQKAYDECLEIARDFTGQGVLIHDLIKTRKGKAVGE